MSGEWWIDILKAFIVGGAFCLIGQLLFDIAKLTPAHTMSIMVTAGSILGGFGIYAKLADWAGAGATLPIISFGNMLVLGALEGAKSDGFWGIWTGILGGVSAGIAASVFFAFVIALIFKPKT